MLLGDYQVLSELGRGGMGVVVLARAKDGRQVAIKVVRQDRARGGALERFGREARLLEALGEDAGFVPLLESGSSPQGPFIVMPYLPGGTLREKLHRGALGVFEGVAIVRAVATAVGRAHAKGIVHRDLKPENVLFTADGRPLVADLGLAKHFADDSPGASQSVSLTREGVMRGTAGYMAPEQMADAKNVGPPADVFALGAILYECMTGEPAFRGENAIELFARVDSGTFTRPTDLRKHLPAWVERAIDAALAHEARDRPADGAAFAALLDPAAKVATPASRRPAGVVAALALLAIAVVALVAARLAQRHGSGDVAPLASDIAAPSSGPGVVPSLAPDERAPPPPTFAGFLASKKNEWRLTGWWGSLRWKSAFPVKTVAFSPDGSRLASGGGEYEARLWDGRTGEDLGVTGNARAALAVVIFGPHGEKLVTGGDDGRVRIQEAVPGSKDHQVVAEHARPIVALAYAPSVPKLYSVSADGAIHVRTAGARGLARVPLHGGPAVASVAFSPDCTAAILVGADGKAHLRTTEGDERDLVLAGVDVPVTLAQYVPGAQAHVLLASGAHLLVYDPATDTVLRRFESGVGRLAALAVALDGRSFAASGESGIELWDVASGTKRRIEGHTQVAPALAYSPDGQRLATGSSDRTLRFWDARTGAALALDRDELGGGCSVAVSADGSRFVTGTWDGKVKLWSATRREPLRKLAQLGTPVSSVALSRDGAVAAAGFQNGETLVVDTATGAEKGRFAGAPNAVRGVALTPDGARVLTAGEDPALRVWDLAKKTLERTIALPGGTTGLSLSAHGDRVATAANGALLVLDVASGATVASIESRVTVAALAPDGTLAASGAQSGQVAVWDLATRTGTPSPPHRLPVIQLAFAPDSSELVSTSYDRRLRFWRGFPAEAVLDEIALHTTADTPVSVAYTADGRTLFVGTLRGVVLRFEKR